MTSETAIEIRRAVDRGFLTGGINGYAWADELEAAQAQVEKARAAIVDLIADMRIEQIDFNDINDLAVISRWIERLEAINGE